MEITAGLKETKYPSREKEESVSKKAKKLAKEIARGGRKLALPVLIATGLLTQTGAAAAPEKVAAGIVPPDGKNVPSGERIGVAHTTAPIVDTKLKEKSAEALSKFIPATPELSEGEQKTVDEITSYRKAVYFSGLPPELQRVIDDQNPTTSWGKFPGAFTNELPPKISRYGQKIHDLMDTIFGPRGLYLVRTVHLNTDPNSLLGYDGQDQSVSVPTDIFEMSNRLKDYPDLVLHEAAGHGTDPNDNKIGIYPKSVLLAVEHGKWRMLKEAFLVEGQFLNHPSDQVLPRIEEYLGGAPY